MISLTNLWSGQGSSEITHLCSIWHQLRILKEEARITWRLALSLCCSWCCKNSNIWGARRIGGPHASLSLCSLIIVSIVWQLQVIHSSYMSTQGSQDVCLRGLARQLPIYLFSFLKLILELMPHHFLSIIFIRSESLWSVHFQEKGGRSVKAFVDVVFKPPNIW